MDSILREEFYNIKKFGVGRVSAFLSEYIPLSLLLATERLRYRIGKDTKQRQS